MSTYKHRYRCRIHIGAQLERNCRVSFSFSRIHFTESICIRRYTYLFLIILCLATLLLTVHNEFFFSGSKLSVYEYAWRSFTYEKAAELVVVLVRTAIWKWWQHLLTLLEQATRVQAVVQVFVRDMLYSRIFRIFCRTNLMRKNTNRENFVVVVDTDIWL